MQVHSTPPHKERRKRRLICMTEQDLDRMAATREGRHRSGSAGSHLHLLSHASFLCASLDRVGKKTTCQVRIGSSSSSFPKTPPLAVQRTGRWELSCSV